MFLSRVHLDPRCREARRDLSDPYQLHATLCRAFSGPERKCPEGTFLWRLESPTGSTPGPWLLLQSRMVPDWTRIGIRGWLASVDPPVDLRVRLKLDALQQGQRFRFRLRANPCVTRNGKRMGLLRLEEQESWIVRKGQLHGFALPRLASRPQSQAPEARVDVLVSQEQMLRANQHTGNGIRVFSVQYDGVLTLVDVERFRGALAAGIGHGKAMGLGLLSVAATP